MRFVTAAINVKAAGGTDIFIPGFIMRIKIDIETVIAAVHQQIIDSRFDFPDNFTDFRLTVSVIFP